MLLFTIGTPGENKRKELMSSFEFTYRQIERNNYKLRLMVNK